MDSVLLALQQLLKDAIENPTSSLHGVKLVSYGDPQKIPASSLPAITIKPLRTAYAQRGTRYDQKDFTIEVRLVYNAKDFWEADAAKGTNDKVYAVSDSVVKMEADSNRTTIHDSIAGIIEKNPTLPLTVNGTTVNTADNARVIEINYLGLTPARGFNSYEVVLTMQGTAIGDR